MSLKIIAITAVLAALASPALAKDKPMDMSKPMTGHDDSSQAFKKANDKMHEDMMIKYSGDADTDFVRSMIPHHQGAIDMAKIELQYGKDPDLRKLAEAVIKAQEAEITEMNAWLKAHGK
ncbi:DUF305 domain-containing protein [Rhizobium sp. CNPSo 3490]|uniref:CopM family metallochaperone n=1 Tax=Rhizobium sp. CNPSo 3490 TaxID=3021407 RepID=UPI00254E7650|nr:DUF305 domain-containing protein [Rhizobium sp. CNPSo 3490]MDK4735035.1 DUF305 domain-containing protein [Rhizobium sp. CNPSo 3490]